MNIDGLGSQHQNSIVQWREQILKSDPDLGLEKHLPRTNSLGSDKILNFFEQHHTM